MLAQICQFFAVDSSNFPKNELVFVGDKSSDGGFLIHYFINLCQKQNRPLCFVGLSQSFNHYNSVAHKLGTNLLSARDENKNLIFIEGLKLISECVSLHSGQFNESNPFLSLLKGNSTQFVNTIGASLANLAKIQSPNAPVVIVDDLSVLLRSGATPKDIILLVNSLNNIITLGPTKGSLIIFSSLDKDEENELCAFLSHLCSVKIEITNLKSGYCKDVHGQIEVLWKDSLLNPREPKTTHSQFKLFDKSVELFALGMSAAVL
ncbi:elongator complex protein 6 [Biomphalaria pfeifferi]|uniref:Elongator complex protein 6 n=1 Tax=Biomphalaria pfeifferi TaxID=112525 RepID=A0AAD8EZX3_BIOPF|nr:elongator complex protein 6 [Biomphalaria pfeifferi]